ncbi:MAG: chloride channel protein, partial [Clostridium sp.]|nr:chloride channel protein [Clostridium sp.]
MGQKLKIIKEKLGKSAVTAASYIRVTVKWCVIGVIMGLVCGLIGALFHHAIDFGTELRLEHPWLIFLLPVGGLAIYFVYKWLKLIPDPGTDAIIHASLTGKHVTPKMALGIFFSTIVTQLVGGSGGREGAALQLGGGISGLVSKLSPYKFNRNDDRVLTLCGMSAVFSSLFGTPVTAALFCMEVGRIGSMPYAALAPC